MFITYASLNGPLLLYPDHSSSTQVRMKLFQLPKFDWGCWNIPKCFWWYLNFSKELVYCTNKNEAVWSCWKLNKAVWSYPILNEEVPLGPKLPFPESWFNVLEFSEIFPIYGNIFNFAKTWMKLFWFPQI